MGPNRGCDAASGKKPKSLRPQPQTSAPDICIHPKCKVGNKCLKLTREFYAQPVLAVARECIGKILVHRTPDGEAAGRIVEAEAYRGPLDLAAHSSHGLTKRTAAMYGPPGYAYVYLLYGTSSALNLVVSSDREPHVVLISALEPVRGLQLMTRRRRKAPD